MPFGIIAGAVAAVGAVAGGISRSRQAAKNNKIARDNEKAQEKYNKQIAKEQNKYNKKVFKADKANYLAMRDYSHETNMKNWERGKEIQDFEYASRLQQYYKSQAVGQQQLRLNEQARNLGIDAEKAAIEEAFIQQQFQHQESMSALRQTYAEQAINRKEQQVQLMGIQSQKSLASLGVQNTINQLATQSALQKETAMVENLVAQGSMQASMQAGKSKTKAQQANMATLHRSLMSLESELSGKYKQAAIQMAQINADASLAEMGVGLNLQRIENAISNAENTAAANIEVMTANMQSTIREAERNIQQIELERSIADVNTRASMMIKPSQLPYAPEPQITPMREFVKPMKVIPGEVAKGPRQNTVAPIIDGVTSAAGTVASMVPSGGGGATPYGTGAEKPITGGTDYSGAFSGGGYGVSPGGSGGYTVPGSSVPRSNIPSNIYK